ncbi:uncharacterized protein RCH25_046642 [Pelodytes ibericus]
MDPGHHTAFLLVILVCILLLILAFAGLMMCFWRKKYFKFLNWKSNRRVCGLMKDQATSMTSVSANANNLKPLIYNGPRTSQTIVSIPLTAELSFEKESHVLVLSEEDNQSQASKLVNTSVGEKMAKDRYSVLSAMLTSGASVFGSMLEMGSMFNMKAKRRSSSMKSGVDSDIMLMPMESPVKTTCSANGPFRATSLPRDLSRSTVLCENSSDQQFTWNTAGLSVLSSYAGHKESSSVPGTLERKTRVSEAHECWRESSAAEQNPACSLLPKTYFPFYQHRPFSDCAQDAKRELNNVTSLDSGLDIIVAPAQQEGRGLNKSEIGLKPFCGHPITLTGPNGERQESSNKNIYDAGQVQEEGIELNISHQEAAKKLNAGHYGRSLWEKREERPLIGIC